MADDKTTATSALKPGAESPKTDPANPAADKAKAIVEKFIGELRNSPVAQHTPSWNFLQTKFQALRDAIEKELKGL